MTTNKRVELLQKLERFFPGDSIPSYSSGFEFYPDTSVHTPPTPVLDKYTSQQIYNLPKIVKSTILDDIFQNTYHQNDFPNYDRITALEEIADGINQHKDEFTAALILETGKPFTFASVEVERAIETLKFCAHYVIESSSGENVPLDIVSRNAPYSSVTQRFPIGLVSCITPFNFPLNLAVHKIGPAMMAGCPWILKPSPKTPLSSALLGKVIQNTSLPPSSWSIVNISDSLLHSFVTNPYTKLLSFTGSGPVGWNLRQIIPPQTNLVLELGGNAASVIDKTWDPLTIQDIVDRVLIGAFYQSGQTCISLQRLFIHSSQLGDFLPVLQSSVASWNHNIDPFDTSAKFGPMISAEAAGRVYSDIDHAVQQGATIIAGGSLTSDTFLEPTILLNNEDKTAFSDNNLGKSEIFGPVFTVTPYESLDDVIYEVNDSDYGLQSSIFSNNTHSIEKFFKYVDTGGIVVNDMPTARVDTMPYGGFKGSGNAKEGVKYAMDSMTKIKVKMTKSLI